MIRFVRMIFTQICRTQSMPRDKQWMFTTAARNQTASRDNKIERMGQKYSSSNRQRCAKIGTTFLLNMFFPRRTAETETKRKNRLKNEHWTVNSLQYIHYHWVFAVCLPFICIIYILCVLSCLSHLSVLIHFIGSIWREMWMIILWYSPLEQQYGRIVCNRKLKVLIYISDCHECRPATSTYSKSIFNANNFENARNRFHVQRGYRDCGLRIWHRNEFMNSSNSHRAHQSTSCRSPCHVKQATSVAQSRV